MKNKTYKKIISTNNKAYHEFFVEKKFEAGIVLFGTEVKSIRSGGVSLKNSYCSIQKLQPYILNLHISPYEKGNIFNKDPLRKRKLLLHKKEIINLFNDAKKKGFSIIPLSMFFSGSLVKLEIGLCRGKKLYDKRAAIIEK